MIQRKVTNVDYLAGHLHMQNEIWPISFFSFFLFLFLLLFFNYGRHILTPASQPHGQSCLVTILEGSTKSAMAFFLLRISMWNLTGKKSVKSSLRPEGRQQKQEELQSCSLWNTDHIHRKTDKMKRQRTLYQIKEDRKSVV